MQTQGDAWFKPSEENIYAGVCLRISPGQFRVFPYENRFLEPFELAVRTLNPLVAVKVCVHLEARLPAIVRRAEEHAPASEVSPGSRTRSSRELIRTARCLWGRRRRARSPAPYFISSANILPYFFSISYSTSSLDGSSSLSDRKFIDFGPHPSLHLHPSTSQLTRI